MDNQVIKDIAKKLIDGKMSFIIGAGFGKKKWEDYKAV